MDRTKLCNTVYRNICKYAEKRNMSITDLERDAGFTRGMIVKWKDHVPQIDNLKTVADVLKVKIDTLLREGE